MRETINIRLKRLVETGKVAPPELYNKIGTSRTTWSGWVNAGRPIPLAKVQLIIANCPNISARWLLTGEGSMFEVGPDEDPQNPKGPAEYDADCQPCKEKDKRIEILEYTLSLQREIIDQVKKSAP
jgi:hypothetical protein